MPKNQMKLGVSMRGLGYFVSAWRHPDVPADGQMRLDHYVDVTRTAERGLFDMAFLADGVAVRERDDPPGSLCRTNNIVDFEPLTLLAALAPQTRNVGLVATASTTYNEPYHIARKFASLDHLSGGRIGWNVVTSWTDQEAQNFGQAHGLPKEVRYDRAREFVQVVLGLWETWEADAFVRDKQSGLFFDPAKLHVLNHKGKYFQVRGPLNVARSPQGRPIIIQAGASDAGRELAAATADVIYAAQPEIEGAQEYYSDVKGRAEKYGRSPNDIKIMPGLLPIMGSSEAEAQDIYHGLQKLIDPMVGLSLLTTHMGDLSGYPVDGPVPDQPEKATMSRGTLMYRIAKERGMTIRQLYEMVAIGRAHRVVIGTPLQVVDAMEDWFRNGAADGFNVLPALMPQGLRDFVAQVVPELQRRGLFRQSYEGRTMRENLGLPEPKPPSARVTQLLESAEE